MKGTGPRPTGAAADGCFEQQLAGLGSFNDFEAAFPELTAALRIPSLTNLAAVDSLPLSPTAAAADATRGGAAAACAGSPLLPIPGGAGCVPRVASLDFVRAFLTARHGGGGDDAPAPPAPAPLDAPRPQPAHSAGTSQGVDTPTGLVQPSAALAAFLPSSGPVGPAAMAAATVAAAAALAAGASPLAALLPGVPFPSAMVPVEPAMAAAAAGSLPASTTAAVSDCRPPPRGGSGGAGAGATSAAPKKGRSGAKPTPAEKVEQRRARRMLSNRESARRSRKRKADQLADLDGQIKQAQDELAEEQQRSARLAGEAAEAAARAQQAADKAAEEQRRAKRLAADLASRDTEIASLRRQVHALKRLLPLPGPGPLGYLQMN